MKVKYLCPECGDEFVECAANLVINWDPNAGGPVERNIDGRLADPDKEEGAAWCVNTDCMWSGMYKDLVLGQPKEESNG